MLNIHSLTTNVSRRWHVNFEGNLLQLECLAPEGELCPCYFGGWEAASFSLISAQHQALILGKRLILGKLDLASSSSSSREYDSASQRNWNEKAKFLTSTAQFPLKRQTKTSINFKLSAWVGGDPESWSQGAQNHFYHTIYCFWVCFFLKYLSHIRRPLSLV